MLGNERTPIECHKAHCVFPLTSKTVLCSEHCAWYTLSSGHDQLAGIHNALHSVFVDNNALEYHDGSVTPGERLYRCA